jgi:hypothetical protein
MWLIYVLQGMYQQGAVIRILMIRITNCAATSTTVRGSARLKQASTWQIGIAGH